MNQNRLIQNIADQIKEAQIKLGYAKETFRFYYPVPSLNALLGTEASDAEELLSLLKNEDALKNTALGELGFAAHEGRIEVRIPPKGAEYVHDKVPKPEFLAEIIELFATHHHCTLDDVRGIFEKYSSDFACEKMPEGTDFDYVLYFPDGRVDPYYYCVKEEMEHTIYHRFTREDYAALMEA